MADFSWYTHLATYPAETCLLRGAQRHWQASEIQAELLVVQEWLADTRVLAVLADNSAAWVIADLACQERRCVHLPLPGFFHPDQWAHALSQSAADMVLTDQPERIEALGLGFRPYGHWQGLTWLRRKVDAVSLPEGTAKISFTSGSTGYPKGVCLSATGLLDTARAVERRLAHLPLSAHLAVLPLALLLENVAGVYTALLRGIPVELPGLVDLGWAGMQGFDPALLDHKVRETAAASVILVPELLKAWATYLSLANGVAPPSLQFAAVGGARVAPELLAWARQAGIPAYQGYGLTEGGSVLAINCPGDEGEGVGRPLDHVAFTLAEGEQGELSIRTRAFLGYVGEPARISHDFATGDLGAFDERGHLHLQGRRKNLLITSFGRNVSPEWVEAALLAQPQILQCIVLGEGQPALSAVVVPAPALWQGTNEAQVYAAIRVAVEVANTRLPDYARVAHVVISAPFTPGNGLATGNGRPRRQAIMDHHAAALAACDLSEEK